MRDKDANKPKEETTTEEIKILLKHVIKKIDELDNKIDKIAKATCENGVFRYKNMC